ncbi:MAG: adenosylmethionine decarboxylase [Actinobacteria bacterium]|nr:MAG: adenosylmethionine decarboxylase [Actinomycetota bacterium]
MGGVQSRQSTDGGGSVGGNGSPGWWNPSRYEDRRVVAVIAESHLAIHTWPEYGYAAVDLFTCSKDMDADAGIESLRKYFSPGRIQIVEVKRGLSA